MVQFYKDCALSTPWTTSYNNDNIHTWQQIMVQQQSRYVDVAKGITRTVSTTTWWSGWRCRLHARLLPFLFCMHTCRSKGINWLVDITMDTNNLFLFMNQSTVPSLDTNHLNYFLIIIFLCQIPGYDTE